MNYSWHRRSNECIHDGALTNSKRPSCFVQPVYPTHVVRGDDCYLFDVDGKRYIDFICALGTNLIGYANPQINEAVVRQLQRGTVYSLSSTIEVEAAEKLKELLPFVGKIRFLKTGSDAAAAAIRIARAHHGVCYENEDMYGVLANKEFTRVPQGAGSEEWIQREMQAVYQEISQSAKNCRDQETSSEEICSYGEGQSGGGSPQSQAVEQSERIGKKSGLSNGPAESRKEAMRDLWKSRFTGTSSRLFKTVSSGMAVPDSPCRKTPRPLILSDGYHGHNSEFIGIIKPRVGVVPDPYILPLTGNEDLIEMAAGVIIEPIITDLSPERTMYLQELQAKCKSAGALLIFDEIITGFRFPNYSYSCYSGVHPDIILLGKCIGGGLPLSVVATKPGIGEGKEWFISSTFAGDTLALAGLMKTMELLKNTFKLQAIWESGQRFQEAFNAISANTIRIEGYPTRGIFVASQMNKGLFFQEACKAGILFGPSFFYNFGHMKLNDIVISSCTDIITRIKNNQVQLEGELPKAPFAQQVREAT